jgi:ATP-dependent Clp protease protease subunit
MASWYAIRARGTGAEVAIYDEIGAYGVSAKGFLAELGALPEGTPVDLRLNSPGGSVFDAVAIHNALKRHEGTVTVWIDGIAASAASYIAMAGDEIVMPENAFLMIHDPSGLVMGTAEDMRAMAEALDKVKGSLVSGYAAKSGRTPEEVSALMAAETWFDAADAVAQGFADRLIEPVRIAARFDIGRFRNAPPVLVEQVEAEPEEPDDRSDGRIDRGHRRRTRADGDRRGRGRRGRSAAAPTPSAEGYRRRRRRPAARRPIRVHRPPAAIRAEAIGPCPRRRRSLPPRGPAADGRPLPREDASLDEVRAALLAAKAEAEPEIAPHHPQPGRSSAARPWGEIVARTFKLKG